LIQAGVPILVKIELNFLVEIQRNLVRSIAVPRSIGGSALTAAAATFEMTKLAAP